jgi:YVTN family beta-propeller protein
MLHRLLIVLGICATLLCPIGCGQDRSDGDGDSDAKPYSVTQSSGAKDDPEPSSDAYLRPGPIGNGRFVLPNGRMVQPAGTFVETSVFPMDVAVSPDGETAVVCTGWRNPAVYIYDTTLGQFTQTFTDEISQTFAGMAFSEAGDRFWVSGGSNHSIYEFDLINGVALFARRIALAGFPVGLELSPDEKFIYTALHMNKRAIKVRLSDGKEVKSYDAHLYPSGVALSIDGSTLYVSNLGVGSISIFDTGSGEILDEIVVEKAPQGVKLSPNGATLYVANTDTDTISVIDTDSLTVTATWNLHDDAILANGAMPVDIETSTTGDRIYVTTAGYDSVDVIDTIDGTVLGRIPTGWYPSNAFIDPIKDRIYVVNAKGVGSAGFGNGVKWNGALQDLANPSDLELADYTDQVDEATRWASNFYSDWETSYESPIPREFGVRSEKIRHAVFILKENKTYDQVLGDLEVGESSPDPSRVIFGEAITPNTHALAREFVNCDNLYVEGDTSVIGHLWATFANNTDHAEKAFLAGGKYPLPDLDPATRAADGPVFKRVLDAGLEFRNYGEIIGIANDLDRYMPYTDLHYGFWNMATSDEHEKAEEIIREWEKGLFPDLIFIVLPNDHNYGSSAGAPTPRYLMGDNDAGVGKLVDWISHSEYWQETAIFVTEDDPQSGWDHIDPHRTIGLVISPWAKRDHVSSVLYSMSSIWLTIEMILGLPPSSKFDQYSAPMYDAFTMTPDLTPYNYIPNPIPFELNGEKGPYADKFSPFQFLVPDGAPGLARVLWAMYNPDLPFPGEESIDVDLDDLEEEEEDEDEEGDVQMYVESVNAAIAWGAERGIKVPVPDGWHELSAKVLSEKDD